MRFSQHAPAIILREKLPPTSFAGHIAYVDMGLLHSYHRVEQFRFTCYKPAVPAFSQRLHLISFVAHEIKRKWGVGRTATHCRPTKYLTLFQRLAA